MKRRMLPPLCLALLSCAATAHGQDAADCATLLARSEEAVARLAEDNARLAERVRLLEAAPTLGRDELVRRNVLRLQEIGRSVKAQRQTMADFEKYISWMAGSLSSYSKYIEAGSAAAALAKFLPVPYAGQAGAFAKFAAHFALSLNSASNAIERYLKTSQQFLGRVDALEPSRPPKGREVAELGRFADEQLIRDTTDVQGKLATTAELSGSALSFLVGMEQYACSVEETWTKTKQLVTRKEEEKKKGFLTESAENLRTQAAAFNGRFKGFDEAVRKEIPLIKSLGAYDELVRELEAKGPPGAR